MKLIATFGALLPLVSMALASAPREYWERDVCQEYKPEQGGYWQDDGELTKDYARNKNEINRNGLVKVFHDRAFGSQGGFMYTLWGGLGTGFDPFNRTEAVVYARADRTKGHGMGQEFRVNFNGDAGQIKSYWITPQHVCYLALPQELSVATVKKITVMHRTG